MLLGGLTSAAMCSDVDSTNVVSLPEALDALTRRIIGDTPYLIVWKSLYRFTSRVAGNMRVGRFLLAGDAAHIVSPWADDTLLDSYHLERHAAAVENLAVTAATMDFLVPQSFRHGCGASTAPRSRRCHPSS